MKEIYIFFLLVFILLTAFYFFHKESFSSIEFDPAKTHPGSLGNVMNNVMHYVSDFDPAKLSPACL